jgi:uncharacterized protein (TIGR03663 family)
MNRWSALAALLIFAAAVALRVPRLSTRPLHNDEAVNAIKVAELWQGGHYAYDPDEYHGPTLHYATLPFLWLSGARDANDLSDSTLRLAPVAFGIGLILLLPLFTGGLDRRALGWAGLFIAISPAMVFYSRYFIHEMLLVFFTALAMGAGWRYTQTRSAVWAGITGGAIGLMFATKETFVITIAAMMLSLIGTSYWIRRGGAAPHPGPPPEEREKNLTSAARGLRGLCDGFSRRDAIVALAAAFGVWALFFSSFFTNFSGLLDSVRTYLPWLKRAGGHSPHVHPWYFYLQRLAWFHPVKGPGWSEGLILFLASVGGISALRQRASALPVFLTIYTILLTGAYSVIAYKTPWCLLSFLFGMILLAGFGASTVAANFKRGTAKYLAWTALVLLSAQLAWQAWRASFVYASDRRNPYVYAQTVPDLLNVVEKVDAVARAGAEGYDTVVKVIAPGGDYWPLPWYLRRFKKVGWYEKLPSDPLAPIIIVASELEARLDETSDHKWIMAGLTELRPEKFLELYVKLDLWKKYLESRPAAVDADREGTQ